MCCIKVKVIKLHVQVKLAFQSSTSVSGYNKRTISRIETKHGVRVDIDEATIWCEVKVIRSKVKVKFMICWRNVLVVSYELLDGLISNLIDG